jgi:hypothetical protein
VTAFAFGLLPAPGQSGVDATESRRGGARTTGGPRTRSWQRRLLVGQMAVVLVLLMSAGLSLESFRRLISQDLGYTPQSLVAIDLSTTGFHTNEDVARWYRALHARLTALPGVTAVGPSSSAPLTAKWTFEEKAHDLSRLVPKADRPSLEGTFVAFDYFPAMGIPLVDGRVFRAGELKDDGVGRLVIINGTAAALLFAGRAAVGGRMILGDNTDRVRFLMSMLAAYAALSLAIAAIGIFGVVACQVAQRTKEFGVRLALGATPRGLARLVLMQAGRVALGGLAIGLALSVVTNRLLAGQVFDVSTHDPVLMVTASAVLLVVALLATLLPAWRAARVDAVEPLRCD